MRFLYSIAVFTVLAGFVFSPAGAGVSTEAAPRFFEHMDDIPIMPGLVEVADQGYVFDKPQGRIGESFAYGRGISAEDVRAYYEASLPQFGWVPAPGLSFSRGGEVVTLSVEAAGNQEGGQVLSVRITPR